jgi:hypothetical protein
VCIRVCILCLFCRNKCGSSLRLQLAILTYFDDRVSYFEEQVLVLHISAYCQKKGIVHMSVNIYCLTLGRLHPVPTN